MVWKCHLELFLTEASKNIVKIVEPIVQTSPCRVELLYRDRLICPEPITDMKIT